MKHKLNIAGLGLLILLSATVSVFLNSDDSSLFKVQVPLIMVGGYFFGTFLASWLIDRMILKATSQNMETVHPYKLLIRNLPFVNMFVFGFFGVMCAL